MTQNDKDLLLKDLCARLPYGVICKSINFKNPTKLVSIDLDGPSHDVYFCTNDDGSMWNDYDEIKPYLFPLSSMTEEQKDIFGKLWWNTHGVNMARHAIDYLNKNHFDYRGLIEKGLAIDATGLNIY